MAKRSSQTTLIFSNWPLYIDVDERTRSTRRSTSSPKETGVKVKYVEDINDNEEFFGKYPGAAVAGPGIGRDIIVLTDWLGRPR